MAPSRRARLWLGVFVVALNVGLFLPGYLFSHPRPDFTPFFPKEHPHGTFGLDARSAVEYVKALLVRRPNLDVWRVSWELAIAMVLVVLMAGRRGARALRWGLGVLYAGCLLVLVYHHAFQLKFESMPALWEDVLLAESGFYFVADSYGLAVSWLSLLVVALVLAGCVWSVQTVFARLAAEALAAPLRTRASFCAVLILWGAGSLVWFGAARNDPFVQLPSKVLVANYATSMARRARVQEVYASAPDRRYLTFLDARLARRPTVHLLMIEAYGQRLVTDPQMKEPFRELTRRLLSRLTARGLHARTTYSRAPVFGGRSWLSISSVQTGVRLEQPSLYKLMELAAPRLPTLTRFFKEQGYHTVALQPANRPRATIDYPDVFRRDVSLGGWDLGYTGTPYDFAKVPDQYSLGFYREEVLAKTKGPYFSFFMSVSTHYGWSTIPYATDWRTLNTPEQVQIAPWDPIAGVENIDDGLPRRYFQSVVYDWRALLDFIESEPDPDAIFILVGDHQPLLERTTHPRFDLDVAAVIGTQSLFTPVHVLARDEAFVNRFAAYGFTEGLFAEPWTGRLMHEGLFSLLVTELVGAYGVAGDQSKVNYFPQGAGVSTLAPW